MLTSCYSQKILLKSQQLLNIRSITQGWQQKKQGRLLSLSQINYKNYPMQLNKIEGMMPVKLDQAIKYYQEGLQNKQRKLDCADFDQIEKINENTFISVKTIKGNLLFNQRYFLTIQSKQEINKDEVLITRSDIESHPKYHPLVNAIKAETNIYGIFLKKIDHFNIYFEAYMQFDLRGRIPYLAQDKAILQNISIFENDINQIQEQ